MHLLRFRYVFLLITLMSFALHAHIFRRDLVGIHVWRQTETATVIRTLSRGDGDLLHPKVFDLARRDRVWRMELPLMQGAFAAVCRLVPVPDYTVIRVLTFLLGLCTVWGIYMLGLASTGKDLIGVIAAWTFNWSPVFYYYTLNPLPDNAALCCAVWGLAGLMRYARAPSTGTLALGAALIGLAAAIKLPYVVFAFPAAILWWRAFRTTPGLYKRAGRWQIPIFFGAALVPAALWYGSVIPAWRGNGVVGGVLSSTTSIGELFSIFFAHLISTGPELLVNYGSVATLIAGLLFFFRKRQWKRAEAPPILALAAGVLLYYVYELPLIGIVHDYYLMPFLPLIFLAVGIGAWWMLQSRMRAIRGVAIVGLLVLPFTAYLRINTRWDTIEPGFNYAYLEHKTKLQRLIPPASRVIVGPDDSRRILLYHLDRIGWTFTDADLSEDSVKQWVAEGAQFLLTDSKAIQRLPSITASRQPVFSVENLSVYALD